MSLQRLRATHDQSLRAAAKYFVVGVISYGLDVSILAVCWHVLHAPLWLSTSAGFWCSFVVNFLLSRHWTFGADHVAPGAQLVRYSVLVLVNYVVTLVAMAALHRLGLEVVIARTIIVAVLTVSTFLVYRRWVFASHGPAEAAQTTTPTT